jgi:hypothetical protein
MNRAVAEAKQALMAEGFSPNIGGRTPEEQDAAAEAIYGAVWRRFSEAEEEYDHFGPMAIAKGWTRLGRAAGTRRR